MLESLLEGMAEYYSVELAEKVSRGHKENALKAKFNGGIVPLGYRIDSEMHYQIDPATAPIVQEAFRRYAEGETLNTIIDSFNSRGFRNSLGTKFTRNSFQTLLRNRRYLGEYRYKDVVMPGAIPAIISEEQFDRVQRRCEKNKNAPAHTKTPVNYLLTTKLFCGKCGTLMVGESGKSHTDKLRPNHLIQMRDALLNQPYKPKYCLKGDLHKLLKKHGFQNYEQFVAASGISINTLTELAMHRPIRSDTANKAAATLGESFHSLFTVKSNGTLSANTVKHYLRLVSSILSKAVDWQYIPNNPMDRVSMPKQEKKEQQCLNKQQAARLLTLLEDAPAKYRTAITVLLLTGIRREEVLGLHWNDIDFEQSLVSIHGAIQYIPGQGLLYGDTKTASSNRVIKVAARVIQALDRFRQEQMTDAQTLGVAWEDDRYVFESLDGHLLRPDTLTSWFRRFILKTDLPPIHIHSLRHTTATLLIESHMPLTAIAGNLGHATPSTTASIYAHALKTATAATADAMDDILAAGAVSNA